ncbi:hypothetical protein nbrc107697_10240 [Gordonia crocea]|uniref:Integral membrane protein n=1 Tax=Gordonia crocea TaxID=589162 RepID=A0A7I9UV36_9ACTN|nr:hypothetical protein nbrc107697_10240 [Gordonia crocea]
MPYSLDTGARWAWRKFTDNVAGLFVGVLVLMALSTVAMLFTIVGFVVLMGSASDSEGAGIAVGIVLLVLGILAYVGVSAYFASAYTGGLIDIANGVPTTTSSFLRPRYFGTVFALVLLQTLAVLAGSVVFCVGGIIVSFFLAYAVMVVVDKGVGAIEAMKTSVSLVRGHLGDAFVLFLVVTALTMVIGVLATPFVQLLTVFAYRRFSGQSVAV